MLIQNPYRILILLTVILLYITESVFATEPSNLTGIPNYTVMTGGWQRTDGSYTVKVDSVQIDGKAVVKYFNPNPIHVEQAVVSVQKDLIKLFIKLNDKGYEGSTYTLYYYAQKDALAGFYYQAPLNRTYQVIFRRKAK